MRVPGPRRRAHATRICSPFPPPPLRSQARRWAGEQWRSCGGDAHNARQGDTAARCRTGEEQPPSSQPREGGWAAEWGGVSGSREWLPRRPGGSPPSPFLSAACSRHDLWFVPGSAEVHGTAPPGQASATRARRRARLFCSSWRARPGLVGPAAWDASSTSPPKSLPESLT